jgi:WhiB family redox-sensing transcriptional regulator
MSIPVYTRPDWHDDANCRGLSPDIFYVDQKKSPESAELTREALRVCRACDVQVECLTYALNIRELDGVWGGMTAEQRRELLRGTPRPLPSIEHGTDGGYHAHLRRGEDACVHCLEAHAALKVDRKARRLEAGGA